MNDIENLSVTKAYHLRNEDVGRLPFLLRNMLGMAEELFGARDESFSVTGIAFREDGPTIHFPKGYEGKEIEIYLQIVADDEEEKAMRRALYQLAHETVHLLSPVLREESTYFEEGVACFFAEYYMKTAWNDCWSPGDSKYEDALALVKSLFKGELESETHGQYDIQNLRRGEDGWRKFGDISQENLLEVCPDLIPADAHLLTSPFQRDNGQS